jgi:hypothetical protein
MAAQLDGLPAPALAVLDGRTERTTLTPTRSTWSSWPTDALTRCGTRCGSRSEAMRQEHRDDMLACRPVNLELAYHTSLTQAGQESRFQISSRDDMRRRIEPPSTYCELSKRLISKHAISTPGHSSGVRRTGFHAI